MKLQAHCPAARLLSGPDPYGPSVVCGVMVEERGITDQIVHGTSRGELKTSAHDPVTVYGFCCGEALPRTKDVLEDESDVRGHHTFCPIWEAEIRRREERRGRVLELPERPTVTPFGIGEALEEHQVRDPRDAMQLSRETVRDLIALGEEDD